MAYKKLQGQLKIGTPKLVSRDSGVRLQVGEPVEVSRLHGEGTFPTRFPEVDLAAEVDRQQLEAGQRLVRENDAERLDDLAMALAAQPPAKQGPDFSAMPRRYRPIDVPRLQRMLSPEGQTPASGGPEYSPEDLGLKTFDGVSGAEIDRRVAAKQAGKPLDAPRAPRVSVGFASEAERPASVEAARRGESLVPAPRAPQLSVPPTAAEPQESDMDRAERTDRLRALMAQLAGAGQLAIGRDASIGEKAVMSQPGAVESLLRRRSLAEVEGAKDSNSEASRKAREKLRGALPGLAKRLGPALDRMTAADLSRFDVLGATMGLEAEEKRGAAAGEAEARALAKEERAAVRQEERDARQNAAAEKRAYIMASLGQQATEGKEQRKAAVDAQKAGREIAERHSNVLREVDALKKMIADKGTWEARGAHNKILEQKLQSIAIDAAKLFDPDSVAREGEVALQRKALFDPGLGTRNETAIDALDAYAEMMKSRLGEAYRARGITPPGEQQAQPAAPKQAPSGAVRMMAPNGQVKLVPAAQVEAAKRAGGKVL